MYAAPNAMAYVTCCLRRGPGPHASGVNLNAMHAAADGADASAYTSTADLTTGTAGSYVGYAVTPLREASQLWWALGVTKLATLVEPRSDEAGNSYSAGAGGAGLTSAGVRGEPIFGFGANGSEVPHHPRYPPRGNLWPGAAHSGYGPPRAAHVPDEWNPRLDQGGRPGAAGCLGRATW